MTAVFAAALVAVVSVRSLPQDDGGFRTKGTPQVDVFVKREHEAAFLWESGTPLRSGDAIRLRTRASGFRRVRVLSSDGAELWSAALDGKTPVFSDTWVLDDASGPELLRVTFSAAPWTWQSLFSKDFTVELVLPKAAGP
ncbi:MAG: hypothetical protein ACT4TC_20760 [Myxococcaceae bacterium]